MKKLFTSLLAITLMVISGLSAQTAWNNYKVTNTLTAIGNKVVALDTMYVALQCRNGKYQSMCVKQPGVLSAIGGVAASYAPQDSITWKIVKGAALGTTPRVRFINLRTGEYLYQGLKGGTSKVAYVAPYNDPFKGVKDFELRDQGTDGKASYHYFIVDGSTQFFNDATDAINLKSTSTQGWKFVPRPGPQPRKLNPFPKLGLEATGDKIYAGGELTLSGYVKKASDTIASDICGKALLYDGTKFVDTLQLDANGAFSKTFTNLVFGTNKYVLVYTGDSVYSAQDSIYSITVGENQNAAVAVTTVTLPATAETHKEVTMDINVKTVTGDVVSYGDVVVYINGTAKNRVAVDVLGNAKIVFPNLIPDTVKFKAVYIGDRIMYKNSDTARVEIKILPSTADIKPYPVIFDLAQQPLIKTWLRQQTTTATVRSFTHNFPKDSVPGIQLQDTAASITYTANALSYTPTDYKDMYMGTDLISLPLGSGRSKWVNFKTPWLNEGSYNIYWSMRNSLEFDITVTSVTMDDKEVYYPGEEYTKRFTRSWNGCNAAKRWNAVGHSGNLPAKYFGSVRVDKSGTHQLKISFKDENGSSVNYDALQFIPVDQDSIKITDKVAVAFAKIHYPLFDLGGFARFAGETAVKSFADISELAVPYQVPDPTVYNTKYQFSISNLGLTPVNDLLGDYVIVYRKEDKWTRVAEGRLSNNAFAGELPAGDYYYEELNYIDMGTAGAAGYRTFISDGSFSVGNSGIEVNKDRPSVFAYAIGKTLSVRGITAGAKIMVADLTGRILVNTVASTDSYSTTLPQGVYLVKVVSGEVLKTKVIVK